MKKNQFCREVNSPWTRRLLHSVPIALSLFVAISSAAEAMAANVTEVSASQQVTEFTGTVVDVNGDPLIGVNVVEKDTENGAITDFEGNFSLSLSSPNAVLVFSYIGYVSQEVSAKNQNGAKIVLKEDTETLDEVVVIGYGAVRKADVAGAVAVLDYKSFKDQPITQVSDALQGRVSGVQVENSGVPGGSVKIRVRGSGSINKSNDPLYVVDGIVRESGLDGINPEDIQSMQVLKDASSTAIYGSRGSNGVVLVTTKTGLAGATQVTLDASFGVANVYKRYDLLNSREYAQALEYYKKAMKDKQAAQTSSIVYAHLGYARILMQQNKQPEAILLLKQGIAISYARVNAIHRNELYENLSTCYEQLHQYHDALKYYKIFRLENDSLFNKDKERDLSEMRFKYDSERQENLIKQSKLDVMQKEQRIQQQTFILIIIVIVLGLLYYLYHRKNKLYLSIVKQNQEAIKRETELNRRIKELETNAPSMVSTSEKYASSSLTDEKSLELFRTLERIMREEKIYKDNFITKDKVAEILGTNRTYLSRIINEQSKLSFTHYVNRFRIEEAIRLLSDPNNETPMKAISAELGFNSISTFYNLFQSSVGMTPSQYRNKVMELQKEQ